VNGGPKRRALSPAAAARGFTMYEVVVALFVLGLVLLTAWTMFGAAGDQQLAGWREADRRSELAAAERSLTAALLGAGSEMPSSAGLGGVHVVRAGAASDTLYVLRGAGPRLRVAARTCRTPATQCIAVLGDGRRSLRAGALVVVGTPAGGLRLMRVVEAPIAFGAACGADCVERILCALVPVPAADAPAVAGSVLHPPAPGTPTPSGEPCAQPVLADGTRCTETQVAYPVATTVAQSCSATGPAATFTEVRLDTAASSWRLPTPTVPPVVRAGAAGTPAPVIQQVEATRYWVRVEDSTLVRQTGAMPGGWASTQPLAAGVVSHTVEILHAGASGWTRGLALPDWFLEHGAHNGTFVRGPAPADTAPRAWRFRQGYHTVAAVRASLGVLRPDGPDAWTVEPRSLVVATPAILAASSAESGS
jgi:prepilin-type N-terminal cleavage/methylation domain-containing protein